MNSALQAYLEASRTLLPRPNRESLDPLYSRIYSQLKDSFNRYLAAHIRSPQGVQPPALQLPPLTVIYSNARTCQIVTVGGSSYLIYDQYLGETFHLLTRIAYHARGEPGHAEAFGLKCVAQQLISKGHLAQAMWVALYYLQFQEELQPEKHLRKFETDTDRQWLTAAQELFVMAHEVCHHFMKRNEEFRALQLVTTELAFQLSRYSERDVRHEDDRRQIKQEYGLDDSLEYWQSALKEVDDFWEANKIAYQEELACDLFARDAVLDYCNSVGLKPVVAMKAIVLVLRYLRLLHYCSAIAQDLAHGRPVRLATTSVRLIQMREHILRRSSRSFVAAWADSGSEVDSLLNQVEKDLHDPIAFRLPSLTEDIRESHNIEKPMRHEDGKLFSREEILGFVEEATGPNL